MVGDDLLDMKTACLALSLIVNPSKIVSLFSPLLKVGDSGVSRATRHMVELTISGSRGLTLRMVMDFPLKSR